MHGFLSVQYAVSLPPSEALRKLFARFPLRPACYLASSRRSSPQPICTVSSPSSMLSRSLPAKLSLTYFHGFLSVQDAVSLPPSKAFRKLFARFSLRPACCLAPSQRSFPQAVSLPPSSASYFHGFLSIQHVISLPPSETLRKLFSHFPPCSMLSPSLPVKLSATYLHGFFSVQHAVSLPPSGLSPSYFHGFLSVQHAVSLPPSGALRKLFSRFPLRPACCLAPSQRSSPQAIWTVSSPSSMLSRFLPAKLSETISTVSHPSSCLVPFQRSSPQAICKVFLSVQHAVSIPLALPPSKALRKLFPQFSSPCSMLSCSLPAKFPQAISTASSRPACCLAPFKRNFPQAICTLSSPSSIRSRSLPPKFPQAISMVLSRPACCRASSQHSFPSSMLSRSHPAQFPQAIFHGFVPSQHAVSLPPRTVSRSYFHGFVPSSMLSRSLPAKFPQAIFHGFVRPAVLSGPACCLAPSQRSFPKLFPRLHPVQHPVSLLPSEVSPSYFHGFIPSSIRSRSLPAKFPQAISTASSRRASGLAPSQRSFPKLFPRLHPVQHPVSLLPSEVSPSYFHGFIPSSIRSRSLPAKFPQAISTASSRRASGLAPSQRSFPKLFPRLHPVQHPVSLLPSAVSPSYFHGFIPSSIRSRSLPAKFPQAISTASSRPASGLAPSQRSFLKLFPRLHPVQQSGLAPSQRSFPKLFPRLHPVEHPVSLPPSEVSPSDFHGFIPSSIRSRSLPAKFPQAISTASSRPASGLAPSQRNFPKLFPRLHPVQHPVSLPPSAVSPSYFHGFIPSSIRSRSLPAQFSQSYFHGFIRRASGLAPSQRSFPKLFPQAISRLIPSSIRLMIVGLSDPLVRWSRWSADPLVRCPLVR